MSHIKRWLFEARKPKPVEPTPQSEIDKAALNKKRFKNLIDPNKVSGAKNGPPPFTQAQLDSMEKERKKRLFTTLFKQET